MPTNNPLTEKIKTEMYASLSIIQYIIQDPKELEKPENHRIINKHIELLLNEYLPKL